MVAMLPSASTISASAVRHLPTLGRAAMMTKLGAVQTGGQLVEISEAGRDAAGGHLRTLRPLIDAVVGVLNRLVEGVQLADDALVWPPP